jgi:putative membrane protein
MTEDSLLDKSFPLADKLAINRTSMANERTLLAYIRTALTIMVLGFTMIRFFDNQEFVTIGWIMIPFGGFILLWGVRRYIRFRRMVIAEAIHEEHDEAE